MMGFEGWKLSRVGCSETGKKTEIWKKKKVNLQKQSGFGHILFGHQGSSSCDLHSGTERKMLAGALGNWSHLGVLFVLSYSSCKNEGGKP